MNKNMFSTSNKNHIKSSASLFTSKANQNSSKNKTQITYGMMGTKETITVIDGLNTGN